MEFVIEINSRMVTVLLQTKPSIKHCYLRLLSQECLQINANQYFTLDDAKKLIQKKQKWLEKNLNKVTKSPLSKNEFYFLGEVETIFENHFDIKVYYRQTASEIIPPLVEKWSNIMQLYPSKLGLRDNKSRWGSCSFANSINLNINLMKFPQHIIEYVIIHELAHIEHKNHSKKFWNLVQKYCPKYKECESSMKSFL